MQRFSDIPELDPSLIQATTDTLASLPMLDAYDGLTVAQRMIEEMCALLAKGEPQHGSLQPHLTTIRNAHKKLQIEPSPDTIAQTLAQVFNIFNHIQRVADEVVKLKQSILLSPDVVAAVISQHQTNCIDRFTNTYHHFVQNANLQGSYNVLPVHFDFVSYRFHLPQAIYPLAGIVIAPAEETLCELQNINLSHIPIHPETGEVNFYAAEYLDKYLLCDTESPAWKRLQYSLAKSRLRATEDIPEHLRIKPIDDGSIEP